MQDEEVIDAGVGLLRRREGDFGALVESQAETQRPGRTRRPAEATRRPLHDLPPGVGGANRLLRPVAILGYTWL